MIESGLTSQNYQKSESDTQLVTSWGNARLSWDGNNPNDPNVILYTAKATISSASSPVKGLYCGVITQRGEHPIVHIPLVPSIKLEEIKTYFNSEKWKHSSGLLTEAQIEDYDFLAYYYEQLMAHINKSRMLTLEESKKVVPVTSLVTGGNKLKAVLYSQRDQSINPLQIGDQKQSKGLWTLDISYDSSQNSGRRKFLNIRDHRQVGTKPEVVVRNSEHLYTEFGIIINPIPAQETINRMGSLLK